MTAKDNVTINLSKPVVVYGGSVTLSGTVSNNQAGEKVVVMAQSYGQATSSSLAVENTTANGQWSHVDTPGIETTYKAQWNTSTSRALTVKVRPRITLARVTRTRTIGTFSTTVNGARSFEGKFVLVQRLTAYGGSLTLKKLYLNSDSRATFKVRLTKFRSRLRVVMPASQAAPGYIAGYSNVLTYRR